MKRLAKEVLLLLLLTLPALLLDRLGLFRAFALRLEPLASAADEACLSRESAAYRPPETHTGHRGRLLPVLPADAPEPSEPEPTPECTARPLPQIRSGGRQQADYRELLSEGWHGSLDGGTPQILILHTHSCECYTPETPGELCSADYRTTDPDRSVIAVGDTLAETLEALGYGVLHDRTHYDDPAYSGAYDRSGAAVEAWLREYPSICIVIDLHRDSLGGQRTEYVLPDGKSAQVMLLLTTGENGLSHPAWKENLALGLELQSELESRCPGFARPLYLSPARYNQQLCTGSFLVEVGTERNTLTEAKRAAVLLGNALDAVLKSK